VHRSATADRHACLNERIQEIEQKVIKHLFGEGLLSRKAETRRQFLGNRHPHRMQMQLSAAVALIGQCDGRLHYRPGPPVDIKLAARKPSQVGRIRRIEQQQGPLPSRRAQVQLNGALTILGLGFEPRLPRNTRYHLRLEFQIDQFVRSRLEYLHSEGPL